MKNNLRYKQCRPDVMINLLLASAPQSASAGPLQICNQQTRTNTSCLFRLLAVSETGEFWTTLKLHVAFPVLRQ